MTENKRIFSLSKPFHLYNAISISVAKWCAHGLILGFRLLQKTRNWIVNSHVSCSDDDGVHSDDDDYYDDDNDNDDDDGDGDDEDYDDDSDGFKAFYDKEKSATRPRLLNSRPPYDRKQKDFLSLKSLLFTCLYLYLTSKIVNARLNSWL